MPFQQLFVLAVLAMVCLAVMRVVRVHLGRSPHPDGIARHLFRIGFVALPPLALGVLSNPGAGLLTGVPWIPVYALLLVGLMVVMRVVAVGVALVAPRRARRVLLALIASEGDPYDVPFNPPVTPRLAGIVALVDRANAVFPRGMAFRDQTGRSGFRASWDALDAATAQLEGAMAEDGRLGMGVAATVAATARDARSRLDTLRQFAVEDGLVWAPA
jgi:hypothetical protein